MSRGGGPIDGKNLPQGAIAPSGLGASGGGSLTERWRQPEGSHRTRLAPTSLYEGEAFESKKYIMHKIKPYKAQRKT